MDSKDSVAGFMGGFTIRWILDSGRPTIHMVQNPGNLSVMLVTVVTNRFGPASLFFAMDEDVNEVCLVVLLLGVRQHPSLDSLLHSL